MIPIRASSATRAIQGRRFGVPRRDQLCFFGDDEYARLFDQAMMRVASLDGVLVEVDLSPFLDAARLLYEGPWVAERYAAIEDFINLHEEAMHPVTRRIIEAGKSFSAVDAFKAQYRLRALKRASERIWDEVDVLLTPTAGTIYEVAQVDADPIRLNTTLGYYTNFMNLLDLTGVAIPAGFRSDGLPFGVTLVGRSATDYALLALADRLHRACVKRLGAMDWDIPAPWQGPPTVAEGFLPVAVCGAHMDGLVLNSQLRERGGYLIRATQTAANYRLFALPGGPRNALDSCGCEKAGPLSTSRYGPFDLPISARWSRAFPPRLASVPSSFATVRRCRDSCVNLTPLTVPSISRSLAGGALIVPRSP